MWFVFLKILVRY
ncbi:hypothetical protein BDFB_011437 [Asbolus verrucosus]|uniref:Uncharacterized protein n=1 Tax=Asbolus verrucosus TaxID=1661398 RepID=A0A482VV83_ASBVE|nr:hypothetical protein BDFB_011437 [Asbolus verrucosus]